MLCLDIFPYLSQSSILLLVQMRIRFSSLLWSGCESTCRTLCFLVLHTLAKWLDFFTKVTVLALRRTYFCVWVFTSTIAASCFVSLWCGRRVTIGTSSRNRWFSLCSTSRVWYTLRVSWPVFESFRAFRRFLFFHFCRFFACLFVGPSYLQQVI